MDTDVLDALFFALDHLEEVDPSSVEKPWFQTLEQAADTAAITWTKQRIEKARAWSFFLAATQ